MGTFSATQGMPRCMLMIPILLVLSSCSDPTEVDQPLYVEISGPRVVQADIVGEPPYEVYECRFDLNARVLGGVPQDEVWLNPPEVVMRLASGSEQDFSMLNAWNSQRVEHGGEVSGRFYLAAGEPFDVTLTSNWHWMQNKIWMDDQRVQYGNTIELSCH